MTGKFYGDIVNTTTCVWNGAGPASTLSRAYYLDRKTKPCKSISFPSFTIIIRSLELSNVCFASDRAFYYIGSFIILCLLHEVRLQSTEFAFRLFETEIVLKSVKRCALNDDRRRQCPSRRPTIFASFRSVYFPPLVFICNASSIRIVE